jgi:hypothetical protein
MGALFAGTILGSKDIAVPWLIQFCPNAVTDLF